MPRVCICGAGLAGSALGALLHDQGWAVTLVERRPLAEHVGYTFTMQAPGWHALDRLGVADALRRTGHRLPSLRVTSATGRVLKATDDAGRVLPGGVQLFRWQVLDALRQRAAGCELITDCLNLPPRWAVPLRNLALWALPMRALAPKGLDEGYDR